MPDLRRLVSFLLIACVGLGACRCSPKPHGRVAAPLPVVSNSTSPTAPGAAPRRASPAAEAEAEPDDYLIITANHTDPAKGLVDVTFTDVRVVAATFDPRDLTGGTAELELHLGTLDSGIAKRDAHLQSPDYLDTGEFPIATIDIDQVRRHAGTYAATAHVALRNLTRAYPVTFEVVEALADGVRIEATQPLSRLDVAVGSDPADDPVAAELIARLRVTLRPR